VIVVSFRVTEADKIVRWEPPHSCGGSNASALRKNCACIHRALALGFGWRYRETQLKLKGCRIDFRLQLRRRVRKLLGSFYQACFHRIHPDIFNMLRILLCISDPVLVVTLLPYFKIETHLLLCPV